MKNFSITTAETPDKMIPKLSSDVKVLPRLGELAGVILEFYYICDIDEKNKTGAGALIENILISSKNAERLGKRLIALAE